MQRNSWVGGFLAVVIIATAVIGAAHASSAADPGLKQQLEKTAYDTDPLLRRLAPLLDEDVEISNKVLYVDFWASWCAPCKKSFPWMREMVERHGASGLQFIGINLDRDPQAVDAFLAKNPVAFPVVRNPGGDLAEEFGVEAMPTAFLFDRRGRLVERHEGFRKKDQEKLEARLAELLNATREPRAKEAAAR